MYGQTLLYVETVVGGGFKRRRLLWAEAVMGGVLVVWAEAVIGGGFDKRRL
jgi:hypothetical protein